MKTDTKESRELILSKMKRPTTANGIIERIFLLDRKNKIKRSWRFYVHLNKLFAPMSRAGLIELDGYRLGETGKMEKVWKRKT